MRYFGENPSLKQAKLPLNLRMFTKSSWVFRDKNPWIFFIKNFQKILDKILTARSLMFMRRKPHLSSLIWKFFLNVWFLSPFSNSQNSYSSPLIGPFPLVVCLFHSLIFLKNYVIIVKKTFFIPRIPLLCEKFNKVFPPNQSPPNPQ